MLSKEDCSISNSIPIVTCLITQLSTKSSADWGVKTLKNGLLESVKSRFCEMESEKHYTVSTYLDPRYKMYYYRDTSTIDEVREIIIQEMSDKLGGVPIAKSDSVSSVSSQESSFTEGSFEAAMRKIAEKKKPKNQEKNSSCSKEDKIKKLLDGYEQLPLDKKSSRPFRSIYLT